MWVSSRAVNEVFLRVFVVIGRVRTVLEMSEQTRCERFVRAERPAANQRHVWVKPF